jgi:hypothetical protein
MSKPEALRLADLLRHDLPTIRRIDAERAGDELRRLHAEVERLRAQQAEPVASDAYDMVDRFLRNNLCDDDYAEYSAALDSLYTTPPRREWVPLTDEQISDAWNEEMVFRRGYTYEDFKSAARRLDAALKEKNHG